MRKIYIKQGTKIVGVRTIPDGSAKGLLKRFIEEENMDQKYVSYFEAQIGSMLIQVNCSSKNHYIDCVTFLEEKFPRMEIVFREWSDGTEEDGLIEKEDWFRG